MTRFMTARRRQAAASVHVVRLKIREDLDIDPVRTSELFANFGDQGAQGLIEDTLADLERCLEQLRTSASCGNVKEVSDVDPTAGSAPSPERDS